VRRFCAAPPGGHGDLPPAPGRAPSREFEPRSDRYIFRLSHRQVAGFAPGARPPCLDRVRAGSAGAGISQLHRALHVLCAPSTGLRQAAGSGGDEVESPFARQDGARGTGAGQDLKFSAQNVDVVLDSVRPYLIADGGNCRVVSVDVQTGDVALEMEASSQRHNEMFAFCVCGA